MDLHAKEGDVCSGGDLADVPKSWHKSEDFLFRLTVQRREMQQSIREWLQLAEQAQLEQLDLQRRLLQERDLPWPQTLKAGCLAQVTEDTSPAPLEPSVNAVRSTAPTSGTSPGLEEPLRMAAWTTHPSVVPEEPAPTTPSPPNEPLEVLEAASEDREEQSPKDRDNKSAHSLTSRALGSLGSSGRSMSWKPEDLLDSQINKFVAFVRRRAKFFGLDLDASAVQLLKEAKCRRSYKVVHGLPFQIITSVAILVNAVFIGVTTDLELQGSIRGTSPPDLGYIEVAFCAWFSTELIIRIAAERLLFLWGPDYGWNCMDSLLVLLSIIDVIINGSETGTVSNVTSARILRLIRSVKIFRFARAMHVFHDFRLLVYSILAGATSLFWCLVVLTFIIYMFAIFFMNGVTQHFLELGSNYGPEDTHVIDLKEMYGSVPKTIVTLFKTISGGADWGDALKPLEDMHHPELYVFMFIVYIFFMFFGVLNVVIGAFVATTSEVALRDREACVKSEMDHLKDYSKRIRTFFQEADTDRSGNLSWEEFSRHLSNKKVQAYFQSLELDVSQAHVLFRLLDVDDSDQVALDEFFDGCMRLKGQARSMDVNMLLYENEKIFARLMDFMKNTETRWLRLENKLGLPPARKSVEEEPAMPGGTTDRLANAMQLMAMTS